MNRRQAIFTVVTVFLILVGMIGLYYGLWRAYQLYQQKSVQLQNLSTPQGILGLLGLGPKPAQ